MGHVRISRRDYEDFWRDTVMNAFCQRRLTSRQADAMQELRVMMDAIDPKTKEAIRECAKKQSNMLIQLLRKLRAGNMRNIAIQQKLGENLQEAWCCDLDALKAKQVLLDFFRTQAGKPNSEQRADFLKTLDEFRKITVMCERNTPPFDRMEELLLTALPELSSVPDEIEQIIQSI
jgi:hypothetical protein